ncbi:MAG: peptidylprolyl isomerase [Bacteroidota bacterium]
MPISTYLSITSMKEIAPILGFLFSSLICVELADAQTIDNIADLQNSRSLVDGKLYGYLFSSDPSERSRAAVALANIQDSSSIPFLLPLLHDSTPIVRRSAAFAIGQIGGAHIGSLLLERLRTESDPLSLQEIIDAVGKCGTSNDLKALVEIAPSMSAAAQSSVALSVARFALRKIKDSTATEYAFNLIGRPECARLAVYAMMRISDSSSVRRHLSALLIAMNDPSPEVRMWTGTVLGFVSDTAASTVLVEHVVHDPDWRVRVNCLRSLRSQPVKTVSPFLTSLLSDKDEHVALTAFSVLNSGFEKYSSDYSVETLHKISEDSVHYSWRRRGEAAILMAEHLKDKCVPQLAKLLDANSMFRSRIISALGETQSLDAIPWLKNELLRNDPRSVSAAVEAYQNIVSGKDSAIQGEFFRQILPLLQKHDIAISYSVAAAFEDTSIRGSLRLQCLPQFIDAYKNLNTPDDVEVMVEFINLFAELKSEAAIPSMQRTLHDADRIVSQAAAHALRSITGINYDAEISSSPNSSKFYKPEDTALLQRYHSALIETSKGNITMEFRADAAPFTVLNFILLAKKHFYDGLIFHRVVPNFVIQGGDPLGTGFGGPGYAIRTEVHPDALYSEGAVGMASAGKDTEGSQFFITHCSTPHLDGRYTIFGYTKDLDVVDKIQIGDTITSVRMIE